MSAQKTSTKKNRPISMAEYDAGGHFVRYVFFATAEEAMAWCLRNTGRVSAVEVYALSAPTPRP